MSKSVSIIGGGYLGQRLATALNLLNYDVKISFRTNSPKLEDKSIKAFHCSLNLGKVELDKSLLAVDCMIICVPPGFKKGLGDFYAPHIKTLVDMAHSHSVKHVIFTSSVGVYPESGTFDESTDLSLSSHKQKVLFDAEQAVVNSGLKNKHVLRLAGLIGPARHPGDFRVDLSSPKVQGIVNMVMIDDVVRAMVNLVREPGTPSQVYNIVSPHHPSKRSFYHYSRMVCGKAETRILNESSSETGKNVIGALIEQETDFVYQYRDLFQAVNSL